MPVETETSRDEIGRLAAQWLQGDLLARIIVDPDRRLLWRNAAAERLLLDCPDLDARSGFLNAEDRAGNAALAELIASADGDAASLSLPCGDGDGHLLFQGRRLARADGGHAVCLSIQRSGSKFRAHYMDFRQTFSLTEKENEIVRLLASGKNADAIAIQTATSVGTVRSHIRSIYVKLDVSSREMLFLRLKPFRIL